MTASSPYIPPQMTLELFHVEQSQSAERALGADANRFSTAKPLNKNYLQHTTSPIDTPPPERRIDPHFKFSPKSVSCKWFILCHLGTQ